MLDHVTYELGGDNLKIGQDGKTGIWYCKEISITCKNILKGVKLMRLAMMDVTELLADFNKEEKIIGEQRKSGNKREKNKKSPSNSSHKKNNIRGVV